MAEEEIEHRDMLLDLHRKKFGEFLPLIRRQDVKGFVTRRADLAQPAAWARCGAQVRRANGIRNRAVLPARGRNDARRCRTRPAHAPRRRGGQARKARAGAWRKSYAERARGRGRDRAAHVRAAIRTARTSRPHGRFRLHPRAAICGGLCYPQHLGDVSRRHWRPPWAPVFRWDLPKRCPTTARSPDGAHLWCAALFAAP